MFRSDSRLLGRARITPSLRVFLAVSLLAAGIAVVQAYPSVARSPSDPYFRGYFTEPGSTTPSGSPHRWVWDAQRDPGTNVVYGFHGLVNLYGTCSGSGGQGSATGTVDVPDMPVAADGSFSYTGLVALGGALSGGAIDLQARFVSATKIAVDTFRVTGNYDVYSPPCPLDSGPFAFELNEICPPTGVICSGPGMGGGENRPPIANPDSWTVRAGWTADENLLLNDSDPDGDEITAKVTKIDFAAKEYSKVDLDGGFLYTAGPGTSKALKKKITYVAIDSKGARSKPVAAIVRIIPAKHATKKPSAKASAALVGPNASIAASTQPYWSGPWPGWARACFGSGLDSFCYTLLSVPRTSALNSLTPWTDLTGATSACLKYGFLPMKNADCAKSLAQKSLFQVWDKSIVRNAAKFGYCLMFRVDRNRSLRHPRAGVWSTTPEFRTLDSLVRPGGYGKWGKWRVPVYCDASGLAYSRLNQPLILAP